MARKRLAKGSLETERTAGYGNSPYNIIKVYQDWPEAIQERIRKMSDGKLLRYGFAAQVTCSPGQKAMVAETSKAALATRSNAEIHDKNAPPMLRIPEHEDIPGHA